MATTEFDPEIQLSDKLSKLLVRGGCGFSPENFFQEGTRSPDPRYELGAAWMLLHLIYDGHIDRADVPAMIEKAEEGVKEWQ